MVEREILFRLKMTFDTFPKSILPHYQVTDLADRLSAFSVDATAIIAGIDPSGGHVYKIENPGRALCYDTPFFVTIGTGQALSRTQFVASGFKKNWSLPSTIWLTYLAKARAQSAGRRKTF